MKTNSFINQEKLEAHAEGKWLQILSELAPVLEDAADNFPGHVPCPFHGGKDGFRFHNDAETTGMAICNTCGSFNPYRLLEETNGWDFKESLNRIA